MRKHYVQWFKGDLNTKQHNALVLNLQKSSGIHVQSNRVIKSIAYENADFQKYIAIKTLLDSDDGHRMMLPSESEVNQL